MKPPASANAAKPNATTDPMSRVRRFCRTRLRQPNAKEFISSGASTAPVESKRREGNIPWHLAPHRDDPKRSFPILDDTAIREGDDPSSARDDAGVVRGEDE